MVCSSSWGLTPIDLSLSLMPRARVVGRPFRPLQNNSRGVKGLDILPSVAKQVY